MQKYVYFFYSQALRLKKNNKKVKKSFAREYIIWYGRKKWTKFLIFEVFVLSLWPN